MSAHFIEKHRGKILPVCARPGMGTTSLVLQIADFYAESTNKTVVFFSARLAKEEIIGRIACQRLSLDYYRDVKRNLLPEEMQNWFEQEKDNIAQSKLRIVETADLTSEDIKQLVRSIGNIGLVVVDDLDGFENKVSVSELEEMAEEMNVPLLTTCGVRRIVDFRISKLPKRKDIKIKELSKEETVYFLFRSSYYTINAEESEAILIVDSGTRRKVPLQWKQSMAFGSLPQIKTDKI